MSIHFISGKPGGGKSLYGMRLLADEIINGSRIVVTNVAVKLPELNAYLQQQYGERYTKALMRRADISDRNAVMPHISDVVLQIDEDELSHFFTFRGNGVRLESVSNSEWKSGKRPDFKSVSDAGVFYVLDEIHIAFNSRAWAETGAEVLYYLSQHRKLGDDVVCITQNVSNVDKQFRSVAQDFAYIKNLSKQRVGWFRLPAMFLRSTYAQPATEHSSAMESGTFTLDVAGLASCYDTAKGVGIHGRMGADTKTRKKGLHWLWFVVGFPLLCWVVLHEVPRVFARHFAPPHPVSPTQPVKPPVTFAPPHAVVSESPAPDFATLSPQPAVTPGVYAETNVAEIFCSGFCKVGNEFLVFLTDGTQYQSGDGELSQIAKRWVVINGHTNKMLNASQATRMFESLTYHPLASDDKTAHTSVPDFKLHKSVILGDD